MTLYAVLIGADYRHARVYLVTADTCENIVRRKFKRRFPDREIHVYTKIYRKRL